MYPNAKVLIEAVIFCPGGTDLLAGLVLDLLDNVEELLNSSEVLLAIGVRFFHDRTMKREGATVDMVVFAFASHVVGGGKMFCA